MIPIATPALRQDDWPGTDNDEDDHMSTQFTITIAGLKSEDVSNLDDWMKYDYFKTLSVNTFQALMTFVSI